MGEHVIDEVGDQLGRGRLARGACGGCADRGSYPAPEVLLERPVAGEHRLKGLGHGAS